MSLDKKEEYIFAARDFLGTLDKIILKNSKSKHRSYRENPFQNDLQFLCKSILTNLYYLSS